MIFLTRRSAITARQWLPMLVAWAFCLVAMSTLANGAQAAGPAPTAKDQAVSAYKAGDVRKASTLFETALKSSPNDASSHYWLGMCYQRLGRPAQAKEQFQWAQAHTSDAKIKALAATGLAQLGKSTAAGTVAKGGKPKIIEFSAVWCGPCKRFRPTWEKARGQYSSQITFQSVDIDDPKDEALVQRYNVNSVPTMIFLRANGSVLDQQIGLMEEKEFVAKVRELISAK